MVTLTVYWPGCAGWRRKLPSASATAVAATVPSAARSWTSAPGTIAPVPSVTVPVKAGRGAGAVTGGLAVAHAEATCQAGKSETTNNRAERRNAIVFKTENSSAVSESDRLPQYGSPVTDFVRQSSVGFA